MSKNKNGEYPQTQIEISLPILQRNLKGRIRNKESTSIFPKQSVISHSSILQFHQQIGRKSILLSDNDNSNDSTIIHDNNSKVTPPIRLVASANWRSIERKLPLLVRNLKHRGYRNNTILSDGTSSSRSSSTKKRKMKVNDIYHVHIRQNKLPILNDIRTKNTISISFTKKTNQCPFCTSYQGVRFDIYIYLHLK
jgi:hypothetical protein